MNNTVNTVALVVPVGRCDSTYSTLTFDTLQIGLCRQQIICTVESDRMLVSYRIPVDFSNKARKDFMTSQSTTRCGHHHQCGVIFSWSFKLPSQPFQVKYLLSTKVIY